MLGAENDSISMRPLLRGTDFDDDVKQARTLLSEVRRLFEEFQVLDRKKEERWGLVFARPTQLRVLEGREFSLHVTIAVTRPILFYKVRVPRELYIRLGAWSSPVIRIRG